MASTLVRRVQFTTASNGTASVKFPKGSIIGTLISFEMPLEGETPSVTLIGSSGLDKLRGEGNPLPSEGIIPLDAIGGVGSHEELTLEMTSGGDEVEYTASLYYNTNAR